MQQPGRPKLGVTVNLEVILECHRQYQLKCPQSEPHSSRQKVAAISMYTVEVTSYCMHHKIVGLQSSFFDYFWPQL